MNLFVHGLDEKGNPIINHNKYSTPLLGRIEARIKEAGATIRHDKDEIAKTIEGEKTFVERGKNTKESVIAIGVEFQVSHILAMRLLKEDGMLTEDGRIRNDKQLPKDSKTYRYFVDSYKFACERWGAENVVGGYIHLDEYTPHMHVFVIPLAFKKRRYKEKDLLDKENLPKMKAVLDAKHIFSKETSKALWQDYGAAMAPYGATVALGICPKGTYDEVASMEGRARTLEAEICEKEAHLDELDNLNTEMRNQCAMLERQKEEARKLREDEEKLAEEAIKRRRLEEAKVKELKDVAERSKRMIQFAVNMRKKILEGIQGEIRREYPYLTVIDLDVIDTQRSLVGPYGQKTHDVYTTYKVFCQNTNGQIMEYDVTQDDYCNQKHERIIKQLSRFFFDHKSEAKIAATVSPRKTKGITW